MKTASKPAPECRLRVATAFAAATAIGEFGSFLVLGDFYSRMLLTRMGLASSPLVDLSLLATTALTATWAYALAGRLQLCRRDAPRRVTVFKAALATVVLGQLTYASVLAASIAFRNVDDLLMGLLMTPAFLLEWVTWSLLGMIYYGGFAISANVVAGLMLWRR